MARCGRRLTRVEHRFGQAADFALGIEEELLLVDAATLRPANIASELDRASCTPQRGEIMNDLYEALIEGVDPGRARRTRGRGGRSRPCASSCATRARRFIGGGLHPDVGLRRRRARADRALPGDPRRDARAASRARRPRALHVHVGMPDPETAIDVCNRMRAHLPLLQALAAHSPFWHGRDSGLASARSAIFRAFPRSTIPPDLRRLGALRRRSIRWCAATGDLDDYTYLWWDMRPSPNLGTVEVRAMDAQTRLETVAGLAALVHALAGGLRRRRGGDSRRPPEALDGVLVPRRARRHRRDDLVARRAAADPRGGARTRSSSRAPTRATSTARTRSRRSSASCARAAARTACARPTPPAGWTSYSPSSLTETYGSTQTTSPIRSQS